MNTNEDKVHWGLNCACLVVPLFVVAVCLRWLSLYLPPLGRWNGEDLAALSCLAFEICGGGLSLWLAIRHPSRLVRSAAECFFLGSCLALSFQIVLPVYG